MGLGMLLVMVLGVVILGVVMAMLSMFMGVEMMPVSSLLLVTGAMLLAVLGDQCLLLVMLVDSLMMLSMVGMVLLAVGS